MEYAAPLAASGVRRVNPPRPPRALLLHDGELADLCALLGGLRLSVREHRGAQPPADDGGRCWDLIVATPKRLFELDGESARSVRMAVLDKDSKTLRSMLQRSGVDLIVRRPVHPLVLRLLILHTLYRGPERRRALRVGVGAPVQLRSGWRRRSAVLADLSVSGCRIFCGYPVAKGQRLRLVVPPPVAPGRPLRLSGEVVWCTPADLPGVMAIAVSFGPLPRRLEARLCAAVDAHGAGPAVFPEPIDAAAPQPSKGSLPDAVGGAAAPDTASAPEDRRRAPRHLYTQHVIALGSEAARVLLGRDLSLGGMRVHPHPDVAVGDELRIGLHLGERDEPIVVKATVTRDDGAAGLVLRFAALAPEAAAEVSRILRELPRVAVGCDDEGEGESRAVVSEILERRPRRRALQRSAV
jgi:hypothetical protein